VKKLLIKMFGAIWYCQMFHTAHGTKDHKWFCNKCNLTYNRSSSDNYLGTM